jgi:hypothetical protein
MSLLALLSLLATPAQESAGSVDALVRCRAVADAAERLGCFDRATDQIATARRSGEMIVLDRAKVVARKRGQFGLSQAPEQMFGGGPEDAATEVRTLTTTVAGVQPATYGLYTLQLANGMVWQTVDTMPFAPRRNTSITLRKTPFGGYRAHIDGEKPVLAKRLR